MASEILGTCDINRCEPTVGPHVKHSWCKNWKPLAAEAAPVAETPAQHFLAHEQFERDAKRDAIELQSSLQVAEPGSMLETDILAAFIEKDRRVRAEAARASASVQATADKPGARTTLTAADIHVALAGSVKEGGSSQSNLYDLDEAAAILNQVLAAASPAGEGSRK